MFVDIKLDPTDWVAIYAAIVATSALVWRIFEWIQGGPKIRVKVVYVYTVSMGQINPKSFMSLQAMNIGQRTVTLDMAGFKLSNKMNLIAPYHYHVQRVLPTKLAPGESINVMFDPDELIKSLNEAKPNVKVKYAFFQDQTDRTYKGKLGKDAKRILKRK